MYRIAKGSSVSLRLTNCAVGRLGSGDKIAAPMSETGSETGTRLLGNAGKV